MKWLELHIGGQKWRIYVVPAKSKWLDYGACYAKCYFDTCNIYISRGLSTTARNDALIHELEHAILHTSGVWDILANALGVKEAKRVEEAVVMTSTAIRHRLLVDLGFHFPKSPYE